MLSIRSRLTGSTACPQDSSAQTRPERAGRAGACVELPGGFPVGPGPAPGFNCPIDQRSRHEWRLMHPQETGETRALREVRWTASRDGVLRRRSRVWVESSRAEAGMTDRRTLHHSLSGGVGGGYTVHCDGHHSAGNGSVTASRVQTG